jgi:hypothetical protein
MNTPSPVTIRLVNASGVRRAARAKTYLPALILGLSLITTTPGFAAELADTKIEHIDSEVHINMDPNTPEGWSRYSNEPPVKLDTEPRAQSEGRAHFIYTSHDQIETLKRNYDPKSFDIWAEKLKSIHPGMTVEEIKATLSAKTSETMVTFGAGVVVCFELDNAYFVHGLFDEKSRLKDSITPPIAITYCTSLRHTVVPSTAEPAENLGLPK